MVYAITSPDPLVTPASVLLSTNHQIADTVATGSDGAAVTSLELVAGTTPPDSVVVSVSAAHIRGAVVPGSGQRFILRFTP